AYCERNGEGEGAAGGRYYDCVYKFEDVNRPEAMGCGGGRIEAHLATARGDRATGGDVGVYDLVGAVPVRLNSQWHGAGVAGAAQQIKHVVEEVRSGVVDGAVVDPFAVAGAQLPAPVVAAEILDGAREKRQGLHPDGSPENAGADVAF